MSKARSLHLYILLPLLLLALHFLLCIKVKIDKSVKNQLAINSTVIQNFAGEKITYDVMLRNIYLGKSYFNNVGNVQVNGNLLNLMVVETKLARFMDTEKIYSAPETLLPVRVERDIYNWFIREKITEDYNQEEFTLTIIKKKGARQKTTVLKKDGYIHNAILLPYFVRRISKLDSQGAIVANLPNRRFEIKLVSIETLKVPAGTFRAYHFKSSPKQFEIWITADERKIPIKIQNAGVLGYSMLMRQYSAKGPQNYPLNKQP